MTTARRVRGVLLPARPRGRDGGAMIVEFALLVPVLLLIVFGTVQYGMYFYASQGGSDVARDLARKSAVSDRGTFTCAQLRETAFKSVKDLTAVKNLVVTRTFTLYDEVSRTTRTLSAPQLRSEVHITVSFDSLDMRMPMLPFVDKGRVTTTADARVEYLPTGTPPVACP